MGPPQKAPLRAVTAEERAALERLSKASSARVDRVRRATALRAVADGGSFAAAARRAGLRSGPAVAGVVRRFNQRGLGAVAIAPGRGRRATDGTAERARIVADAGASYQKTRSWCPTGTAERKRKAGVARVVDPRTEEKRG